MQINVTRFVVDHNSYSYTLCSSKKEKKTTYVKNLNEYELSSNIYTDIANTNQTQIHIYELIDFYAEDNVHVVQNFGFCFVLGFCFA